MTTEITEKPGSAIMSGFATATPGEIKKFAESFCRGLSWNDRRAQEIIFLLHCDELPASEIFDILGGSNHDSSPNAVEDAIEIFEKVTVHAIGQGSPVLDHWLEFVYRHGLSLGDHLIIAITISLVANSQSSRSGLPQEYIDGVDKILVQLINRAYRGIAESILTEKHRGKLCNLIKTYFRSGTNAESRAHVLSVLSQVDVPQRDLLSAVFYENGYAPCNKYRFGLYILEQVNYAFVKLVTPQEMTDIIKKSVKDTVSQA